MDNRLSDGAPAAVSFSSCGWLMLYNFGVAKAFAESDLVDLSVPELLGSSGGSLCAVGLVLELDFEDIANFAFDCVERTHGGFAGAFELRTYAGMCIDRQWSKLSEMRKAKVSKKAPNDEQFEKSDKQQVKRSCDEEDEDDNEVQKDDRSAENHLDGVESILAGRVTVSVTTLPWLRNKRYNSFDSMDHVKTVLLASCTATPLAGFPFKLDGEWVIDGGLADFQPLSETLPRRSTVTVSPFYCSHADIRPSRYIPLWWAIYPPRRSDFEWVFALGYDDANTWLASLKQKGALKIAQKVNKKSALKSDSGGSEARSGGSWWQRSESIGDNLDASRFPSDASQGKWVFDPLPALMRNNKLLVSDDEDAVSLGRSSAASSACTSATVTPNSPLFFGNSHPTMSYASIWPYAKGTKIDGDEPRDTTEEAVQLMHSRHYSEYSFQRVFGYRSVLRIIPSGALDLLLIALVFIVFQPLSFLLVYVELILRVGVLGVASLYHSTLSVLNASQDKVLGAGDKVVKLLRVITKLLMEEFSIMQRLGRPLSPEQVKLAANAAADAAAAEAVNFARKRSAAKKGRRARRDVKRRFRATIRAIFNPILFVRMIPLLGKPLTGDAYALRRSLCELSVVYRICVHFL